MKLSKYNICISSGDSCILYNCRRDYMFQVAKPLYDIYMSEAEHPGILSHVAPDFFQHLVGHDFVIDDDVDEAMKIKEEWQREDQEGNLLQITINPTLRCNLRCYYCYEEHQYGSYMQPQVIDATIKYIRRQLNSGKFNRISLSFFGGEPLLYFNKVIKPILDQVGNMNYPDVHFDLNFTSNITLLTKKITEYLLPWHPSFQITIDGNEFIHNMVKCLPNKSKSAYRIAINNIRFLLSHKLKVAIRFNYTAKTLERFYDVIEDLRLFSDEEKLYANINFHRIWQDTKIPESELQPVVDDLELAFREAGFYVISSTSRTIGRCYADVENSLVINYDGKIYKCTARDFNDENSEGLLLPNGNIKWNQRHQKRIAIRYCNPICMACTIFPLCHGGCSQSKLESNNPNYCVKGFSERDKENYVVQRIKGIIAEQYKKGGCPGDNDK